MKKELTAKQIQSNGGKARWKDKSKKSRSEHMKMMSNKRWEKYRAKNKADI